MDNKKRKTMCLNCEYSYRDKSHILRCHKGHTTSVTYYDCESYAVFLEDKEDLYKMYKVIENLTKHNSSSKKDCYRKECRQHTNNNQCILLACEDRIRIRERSPS